MLWRTPTAVHILLRPGVHFKSIKGNALPADENLRQAATYLPVKPVLVHAQVSRGIAEADQTGLDMHRYRLTRVSKLPSWLCLHNTFSW